MFGFLILFLLAQFYSLAEYAFATTVTDNVIVTLDVDSGITISNGANTTLLPNISISNNSAIGGSAWTVRTNNSLGYTLAVQASDAPALASGPNSFADYATGTPTTWNVPNGNKQFGYSAYGSDTPTGTWGDETANSYACGTGGVANTDLKYVGFLTTDKTIATSSTVTPFAGTTTSICFVAEQKGIFAESGTYNATITGTATTL